MNNNQNHSFWLTFDNSQAVISKKDPKNYQENDISWNNDYDEGKLTIDVAETAKEVLIVCPMAGSEATKIEVNVHNDLLTVRGFRNSPLTEENVQNVFHQECFWGKFSRSIVLPVDVKGELAKAEYKNGLLLIRIPKMQEERRIPVMIVEE